MKTAEEIAKEFAHTACSVLLEYQPTSAEFCIISGAVAKLFLAFSDERCADLKAEIQRLSECSRGRKVCDAIIDGLEAENERLKEALENIAAIKNKSTGCDWDEIEEARVIATTALNPSRAEEEK